MKNIETVSWVLRPSNQEPKFPLDAARTKELDDGGSRDFFVETEGIPRQSI